MEIKRLSLIRNITRLFLIFFVLSNFTLLNEFLPNTYPHLFCADKGQYLDYELPTKRYAMLSVQQHFSNYRYETKKDILLYRRFKREWWQIWNWYDFMTHERWSYPYAATDEET